MDINIKTKIMRVTDIVPAEYNPRVQLTKADREYKALNASIEENGLVVPLIVNERTGTLVGGHQRLTVLKDQGVEETEVVVIDCDPAKEKALCIALNKIEGSWDHGALYDLLQELSTDGEDLLSTGFSESEIGDILGELEGLMDDGDDEDVPDAETTQKKADTKPGVPCRIGTYEFRMDETVFGDMMADIREKVGFSVEMVNEELKRRLLAE